MPRVTAWFLRGVDAFGWACPDRRHSHSAGMRGPARDGFWVNGPDETTIHAGQSRRYPLLFSIGASRDPRIKVSWTEDDRHKEQELHIRCDSIWPYI